MYFPFQHRKQEIIAKSFKLQKFQMVSGQYLSTTSVRKPISHLNTAWQALFPAFTSIMLRRNFSYHDHYTYCIVDRIPESDDMAFGEIRRFTTMDCLETAAYGNEKRPVLSSCHSRGLNQVRK